MNVKLSDFKTKMILFAHHSFSVSSLDWAALCPMPGAYPLRAVTWWPSWGLGTSSEGLVQMRGVPSGSGCVSVPKYCSPFMSMRAWFQNPHQEPKFTGVQGAGIKSYRIYI